MEASASAQEPPASVVGPIHDLLTQAEKKYHEIFDGHVADEIHRFDSFLSTVRMIVDQSADSASKEQV